MSDFALEFLGYTASAFVVASLAMSSVLKLRILSLIGSTTFLMYGLLIDSIPVAITNGVIMVINLVFLYRLLSQLYDWLAEPARAALSSARARRTW